MLKQLQISNYTLIDNVSIDFANGLNIITGETGAGKSIMIGALSLLFGSRTDVKAVKSGDKKSVIECTFDVGANQQLKHIFEEAEFDWNDGECILRREISPNGRSRAFINDTPATIGMLHNIALRLVDIHSQHQNQLLWEPTFQLDIIDSLAKNIDLRTEYSEKFEVLKSRLKELKATKIRLKKNAENADFMRYRLDKIKTLNPVVGEYSELKQSREELADAVAIADKIYKAEELINSENGIISQLAELQIVMESFDESENENKPLKTIEYISSKISDISRYLSTRQGEINSEPGDLEFIDQRLGQYDDLIAKMGVADDSGLIALHDNLSKQLDELKSIPEILKEYESAAREAMKEAKIVAAKITASRIDAAKNLESNLLEIARPLGMSNLRCEIRIEKTDLSATGGDKVEFLFAFNKNQQLMPVKDSASGGEVSRLMLCIKAIIADHMELPTIIFDEVDTGVSGDVAAKMGNLMRKMSANTQTIVITHLPQVAAKGDWHFRVFKEDDTNATHTHIKLLSHEERIDELSVMLGGDKAGEASRKNAIALLGEKLFN